MIYPNRHLFAIDESSLDDHRRKCKFKALVLYFSDTFFYSINTLHLKKGKKKTKNPEVTDMSGSFWKELRLAATLTGAGKSLCSFLLFCYSKEENQVHIIN